MQSLIDIASPQPTAEGRGATTKGTSKLPECPHLKILDAWSRSLPAMPRHDAALWRGTRRAHLQARWRETAAMKHWKTEADGLAYFEKLFHYIGKSVFLTGRAQPSNGHAAFVIELEWLVKPANWAKVLEGKYHQEAA